MRDIHRLNAELKLLESTYRASQLEWANDCSWILIHEFKLPNKYNKTHSDVLVFVPENYGYGVPYRDAFLTPGLKLITRHGKTPLDSKYHYFDRYPYAKNLTAQAGVLKKKGWAYICLHQIGKPSKSMNIRTFLDQLFTFLSNPQKHAL